MYSSNSLKVHLYTIEIERSEWKIFVFFFSLAIFNFTRASKETRTINVQWKCIWRSYLKTLTEREIKEDNIYLKFGQFFFGQTDRQTDIVVHREVTLPKKVRPLKKQVTFKELYIYILYINSLFSVC